MIRRPPRSPLFPYPPLFRSREPRLHADSRRAGGGKADSDEQERDEHQRERRRSQARERRPQTHRRGMSVGVDHPNQPDHGGEREGAAIRTRSEEHTSELQSPCNLVCRLLLEKKKQNKV